MSERPTITCELCGAPATAAMLGVGPVCQACRGTSKVQQTTETSQKVLNDMNGVRDMVAEMLPDRIKRSKDIVDDWSNRIGCAAPEALASVLDRIAYELRSMLIPQDILNAVREAMGTPEDADVIRHATSLRSGSASPDTTRRAIPGDRPLDTAAQSHEGEVEIILKAFNARIVGPDAHLYSSHVASGFTRLDAYKREVQNLNKCVAKLQDDAFVSAARIVRLEQDAEPRTSADQQHDIDLLAEQQLAVWKALGVGSHAEAMSALNKSADDGDAFRHGYMAGHYDGLRGVPGDVDGAERDWRTAHLHLAGPCARPTLTETIEAEGPMLDELADLDETDGTDADEPADRGFIPQSVKDLAARGFERVNAPGHKACLDEHVGCVSGGGATCIYLKDGSKVRIRRDENAPGRAWLEHVSQDDVGLAKTSESGEGPARNGNAASDQPSKPDTDTLAGRGSEEPALSADCSCEAPSFAVLGAQIDTIRSVMARYEDGRLNALAVVNELRALLSSRPDGGT